MPQVWIPAHMRHLTGGLHTVRVAGASVRQVIENLEAAYPGTKARLCQDGDVMPGLAVIVDGEQARMGLLEPVGDDSEVHFLPAIGGGCQGNKLFREGQSPKLMCRARRLL